MFQYILKVLNEASLRRENEQHMKSLDNKLIIYDSNCKVCSSFRELVLKFTSIPEAQIKAYADLSPDLSTRISVNEFRNVMALIDTKGGDTIYGAEGIAYIFSSQYRVIDFLLGFRPVLKLFSFLYKTQAYNRYIIATPKSKFKCDCFPDRIVKYRVSYIIMTCVISLALTALFGISVRSLFGNISPAGGAARMLLMAGTGWVVQMIAGTVILKGKALDYIGHLGSIMVVGLLILIPWMLLHALTGTVSAWLVVGSVLISSGYMLYLHIQRARYLELSQIWTVSWLVLLQSGAGFWIGYFINQ